MKSLPANESSTPQRTLGIYVHWPYCEAKCPYCDFNSYARRTIGEDEFLSSALREIAYWAGQTDGGAVSSIFFGGGTPSLMTAATVGAIVDAIAARWVVEDAAEITLEANPSSVEASRFAGYRAAGVNRVSLGVQSLDDSQLRFLGRLHSAAEARAALAIAARHFERLSFDLIYARPGQTRSEWEGELKEALALSRGHLSLYQLTIEPQTAFFDLERRGKLAIPASEDAASLYEMTQEICDVGGLPAYEISNHATPGQEGRHNLLYWRYGNYLGIGPGAHGRIAREGRKVATATLRSPQAWHAQALQRGHGLETATLLTPLEMAEETVLMGLRIAEGVPLAKIEAETGYTVAASSLAVLIEDGLIALGGGTIAATQAGRLVLNSVVAAVAAGLTHVDTRIA